MSKHISYKSISKRLPPPLPPNTHLLPPRPNKTPQPILQPLPLYRPPPRHQPRRDVHARHARHALPRQHGPLDQRLGARPVGQAAREADRDKGAREAPRDVRGAGLHDGSRDEVGAGGARGRSEERGDYGAVVAEAAGVEEGCQGEVAEVVVYLAGVSGLLGVGPSLDCQASWIQVGDAGSGVSYSGSQVCSSYVSLVQRMACAHAG